ncbi:MAG: XTP/dITP diphosphatase [Clostridia bacterium]|nr:XTP/dITP diphosphatase [Clostridia bacterium]
MKLILASKNAHKAKEMQAILGEGVELITQDAAGCGGLDVVEDGSTFEENSIKKAVTIMQATGLPTIADDSGLCVDALDGRPGIFTARFAGEDATDDRNIQKLLTELQNVEADKRSARFVCVIALAIPGEEPKTFRGECEGRILTEKHGENGFGYDPVFYLPQFDASMAQVSADEKNSVSHRFNALKLLKEYLD